MANDAASVSKAFANLSAAIEEPLEEAKLLELGHLATTIVLLRTKKGMDVDGNPFHPYSASYTEERQEHGLSSQPDLVRTGHTLGAMLLTASSPDELTIHFANPQASDIATYLNSGTRNMAKREFMDIRQQKEIDLLADAIGEGLLASVTKKFDK